MGPVLQWLQSKVKGNKVEAPAEQPLDAAGEDSAASLQLHIGVPWATSCLAVDPVQGTVALGGSAGEVKLLGLCEQDPRACADMLLPPQDSGGPVVALLFLPNEGRLLVLQAPALLRIWRLTCLPPQIEVCLPLSTSTEPDPSVTIAALIPRSPFLLVGTGSGAVVCAHCTAGRVAGWALPPAEGAVCALEPRPSDPTQLLLGRRRLRVASLRRGATASSATSIPERTAPLTCARWLCAGGGADAVAGYADGAIILVSLGGHLARATPLLNPYATGPCRPLRWLASLGPSLLLAVGGTSSEVEPEALSVLRGAGGCTRTTPASAT
jgi:hypothetical protein